MKISQDTLIDDLEGRTLKIIAIVSEWKTQAVDELNNKPSDNGWSAMECLGHLNFYGDFYLPEIEGRLRNAPSVSSPQQFKSGLLGNYFAKSLLPKHKLNKMATFKSMNPAGKLLGMDMLHKFLAQQETLLQLLATAKGADLTKTKTAISISKVLKLRLGDTLRVVIYHNQRHIVQALRALGQTDEAAALIDFQPDRSAHVSHV